MGLPLFGKEGSGTPVFKILVRALALSASYVWCKFESVLKTNCTTEASNMNHDQTASKGVARSWHMLFAV